MTGTKLRIYDLVHAASSSQIDEDEKVRKEKQSDLTKLIVTICSELGFPEKTASSSIDEELKNKIIALLDKQGIKISMENIIHAAKTKTRGRKPKAEKEPEPPPEPVKPKSKLIIVRRIKPTPPPVQQPPPVVIPEVEKKVEPVKLDEKKITMPSPKLELQAPKRLGISLPLQPFRVAKPTVVPSMMGRTKRPHLKKSSARHKEKEKKEEATVTIEKPVTITIASSLSLKELAERLILPETEIVKHLFAKGIIRTVNQIVEHEIAVTCAKDLGYEVITKEEEQENLLQPDISKELEEDLVPRSPVVTIMGHVDHGKTSLLDAIRETKLKLTDQEKGGITQHIGAYQVEVTDYDGKKRKITFLDTPGHEAFTALRARGAQVTDIAVLVVAADDGVMPQTIEAIDHARAASVPIIIALNKIDKEGANPDRVLGQLTEHNLLIEDYGGKTVCSKISAKKRINLDDLLTKITLVADAELGLKLRANPAKLATGVVIEAELSKEKGPVAHLLVQGGTLKKADCIVAGNIAGRVRAMFDNTGCEVEEAPPSCPVEIIGLPDVPNAGDTFQATKNYQEAKQIASERLLKQKETKRAFGLADFALKVKEGQIHELNIIIKADVHGSAEAVSKEVLNLSTNEVLVKPVHIGSGNISENDVNLASSTGAIIIGFHVSTDVNAQKIADENGVDIRIYDIIYKITEDLEKAILGLLEPEKEEVKLGTAEVRKVILYGKGNKIAGSYVTEGKIQRNQIAKVSRGGKIIYEGKIDNLKRFKDDAREVQINFECGISFEGFNDLEEGDIIECWTIIEKERTSLN